MLAAALTEAAKEGLQAPEIPFPESYSGKYKHRRSTCGWQLYEAVGVAKGDRAASRQQMLENYRFFNAPQVAILTIPKELARMPRWMRALSSPLLRLPRRPWE